MGLRGFFGLNKEGAADTNEGRRFLDAFLDEFEQAVRDKKAEWSSKISGFETGRRILESERAVRAAVLQATLALIVEKAQRRSSQWYTRPMLKTLASTLLRRDLGLALAELAAGLDVMCDHPHYLWSELPVAGFIRQCQEFVAAQGLPPELEQSLSHLKNVLARESEYADARKLAERIDVMLGKPRPATLDAGDVWAGAVLGYLESLEPGSRGTWDGVMQHASVATGSKPTKTWLANMKGLLEPVGLDGFESRFIEWAALVGEPGAERSIRGPMGTTVNRTIPTERNAQTLKGLVWTMAHCDTPAAARALGNVAEACFKKIPGFGARCPKVGNACAVILGMMSDAEAAAQLNRLLMKFKLPSIRRIVDKSLNQLAARQGLSQEELTEMSVPTFGLGGDGVLRQTMGSWAAELRITDTRQTELTWLNAEGKRQRSVPAEVKTSFADDWKSLKRTMRDLQKMVPAQRDRLERLLTSDRHWTLAAWTERYRDHPLLRHLTRRLIWQLDSTPAIWEGDRLVDVAGQPVAGLRSETMVRLWHPMGVEPQAVLRWRDWLSEHEITQPFKQAHREIYILTDAERQTDTYSNRFAGHIVKQHQFAALCQQRGWRYHLQGSFDSSNTPTLELPQWELCAQFWIEPGVLDEVSSTGIYVYASTDQVRFYRGAEMEPLSLSEVPSRVFSEVMRDVDLFVGVASVSNDPTWSDGGPDGRYRDYWRQYSFGDLSASAKTRKEVLQKLILRLKIAPICSFEDRFLVVKGSIRTYKIHLGSANVLMSANDQYLCIVPKQGPTDESTLHLPFEGDRTLSVILSKAFMLADDSKIKDPGIVNQLRR